MTPSELERLLASVASGEVAVAEAFARLRDSAVVDFDFARLDLHRELRQGQPEAVFGEGKAIDDLLPICRRLVEAHGRLLVTRVSDEARERLLAAWPDGVAAARGRTFRLGGEPVREPGRGEIALLAAGTADLAVAEEAAESLRFFGRRVAEHFDVGVAGIHRLFGRLEAIRRARAVVVVAGMDGALASVVAGLVRLPIVAVPTSVGYGAAFAGLAPLLAMLNACSPGVAVVNIDNGYGAAAMADRIAALAEAG